MPASFVVKLYSNTRSKGITDSRSMRNHVFKYCIAIYFLSETRLTLFNTYAELKLTMMSITNNESTRYIKAVYDFMCSRSWLKAMLNGISTQVSNRHIEIIMSQVIFSLSFG